MRRRHIGLVVLVAAMLGLGAYGWDQLRFPASSVAIPGTPVTLRVQGSVDDRSVSLVRDGVVLMHRYLSESVGGAPRRSVEARIAATNPCAPFASLIGATGIGIAEPGWMCVDTANEGWPTRAAGDGRQVKLLAAHEYAHTWQAEQGCYLGEDKHTHQWLFEGIAEYLSWQALLRHGGLTRADLGEYLRYTRAEHRDAATLRSHESEGDGDLYGRWHLAVRRLTARAPDADRSLLRFCRSVGRGEDWRPAFTKAFGIRVDAFYASFDRTPQRGGQGRASRRSRDASDAMLSF